MTALDALRQQTRTEGNTYNMVTHQRLKLNRRRLPTLVLKL